MRKAHIRFSSAQTIAEKRAKSSEKLPNLFGQRENREQYSQVVAASAQDGIDLVAVSTLEISFRYSMTGVLVAKDLLSFGF